MNSTAPNAEQLLHQTPFGAYLRGPQPKKATPKRAGRPKKETPEYYAGLLRGHAQVQQWFEHQIGRPPRSDAELYTVFRKHVFSLRMYANPHEAEVADELLAVRLKTALNALGRARRYFRELHRNTPISGMDQDPGERSNVTQETRGIE